MTVIIPFRHPAKHGSGFIIANLPMPDGTRHLYYHKKESRNSIAVISSRWQQDRSKMRGE